MPNTGSPVTRSKTKTSPIFVSCTTAGIVRPARVDVDENRLRRQVVVPDVVMDQLLMPAADAGRRVERDQRVGVEVGPGPIAAVEVVRRRAQRQVHQAARLVHAHRRPDVDAGAPLPGIGRPGVVARLSRPRHGVEPPALPARSARRTRARHRPGRAPRPPAPARRRSRGRGRWPAPTSCRTARPRARRRRGADRARRRRRTPPRSRPTAGSIATQPPVARAREDRRLGGLGAAATARRHDAATRTCASGPQTDRRASVRRRSRRRARSPCWSSS